MIPEGWRFRKLEPFILPAIVVLVGFSAFGLGRLSALDQFSLQKAAANYEKNFVASVNGAKYYVLSCTGAEQIKEENRIWFATEAQAREAGYERVANC
ncbi:hypothetical protein A2852_02275 [Candidatus Adlerbacteria bacterium RIFCSPHIGHO2_01_FULL_54_23]|uniref:Ada DNA repair metal-binding domain-containing protein n=3 Tax=Candidatus Adleribacteriota TaxID=1752736 RepID=A0A1F4Y2N1_9BACT|nr:MAG: hypothetical protein UY83_C0002G0071 [Candidatus Adlerbacteria bacterium GW2011_GWA1_54_10]KKW37945.1 MAG: hypothetical protein UY86_C0002G0042 [Candidatus Adlerbacteria bacterium GW2011_GWB1_54_7]OGC78553.1 MAG: hypothetical protein A2852_02275 [Candidatus Adlerbacteria bacterium RIFCSPHIGHO2_01_FULL_54_23]OGC87563.1 MAG: hypothetical protein A3B33_01470 [Candidatus Adlerbacteria bacterium RIFCSPLOWO2_01_FULL_54_16]